MSRVVFLFPGIKFQMLNLLCAFTGQIILVLNCLKLLQLMGNCLAIRDQQQPQIVVESCQEVQVGAPHFAIKIQPDCDDENVLDEQEDRMRVTTTKSIYIISPDAIQYFTPEGDVYRGQMLNGLPHGFGKYSKASGGSYEGHWKNGFPHGQGYQIIHGATYDGQFHLGLRNGFGKLTFTDGFYYQGQFKMGVVQGYGKFVTKRLYVEGTWKGNMLEGKGFSKADSDNIYEGQFRKNRWHGQGVRKHKDGTTFKGNFKNGKKFGIGKQSQPDGTAKEGIWHDKELVNEGSSSTTSK